MSRKRAFLPVALLMLLAVAAALAVYYVGPLPLVALAVVIVAALLLIPRPELTVAAITLTNLLALAKGHALGAFAFATFAAPMRGPMLALFVIQAVRTAVTVGAPVLRLVAPFLPLISVIALSILAAPFAGEDAHEALPFCALLIAAAIVAWRTTESPQAIRRLIESLAWVMLLIALLNLILAPLVNESRLVGDVSNGFLETRDGTRFQGIFENPNSFGLFGLVAVPFLLGAALLRPKPSTLRTVFLLGALLVGVEVVLSVSRAGILALLLGAIVLGIRLTQRRFTARAIIGSLVAILVALAVLGGVTGGISENLRFDSLQSGSGRNEAWSLAIDEVEDEPVFGYGYGSERQIVSSFPPIIVEGQLFVGEYLGNAFLDAALQMGILGVLAYAIAVGMPLFLAMRLPKHVLSREEDLLRTIALVVVAGGVIEATAESYALVPGGGAVVPFWFSIAICTALAVRVALTANSRDTASVTVHRPAVLSASSNCVRPIGSRPSA